MAPGVPWLLQSSEPRPHLVKKIFIIVLICGDLVLLAASAEASNSDASLKHFRGRNFPIFEHQDLFIIVTAVWNSQLVFLSTLLFFKDIDLSASQHDSLETAAKTAAPFNRYSPESSPTRVWQHPGDTQTSSPRQMAPR
jgi:hypothetical protein